MKIFFEKKRIMDILFFILFSIQSLAYSDEVNVNYVQLGKYQSETLKIGYNYFYLDLSEFKNEDYLYFKVSVEYGYFTGNYLWLGIFSEIPNSPSVSQKVYFCSEEKGDLYNEDYYIFYKYNFRIPKPKDNYIIVSPPGSRFLFNLGNIIIQSSELECSGIIPENYYLDGETGRYYECYNTCKKCSIPGTEENHNCDECKTGYIFLNEPLINEKNCLINCKYYYYFNENGEYICTTTDSCPTNYKLINPKRKCINECKEDNDNKYIFEYNNNCLEECPSELKTDEEDKKCFELCPSNKSEYKNTCLTNCPNDTYKIYIDRNICINSTTIYSNCGKEKCSTCCIESIDLDLCVTCNEKENYYPKLNDPNNKGSYIDCHKNLEKYYVNENIYEPCYESCQTCEKRNENKFHNCKTCDPNYTYIIEYGEFNFNCYKNCTYYHYYDYIKEKYYCTEEKKCPEKYSQLIPDINECVDNCTKYDEYKYTFRNQCLNNCPPNTEKLGYYCKIICPKESPFEIIKTQECVSNCGINDLENNICIINYISNETNEKIEEEMVNNIQEDLSNGYDTTNIDEGKDVIIEQKNSKSTITISSTENQKKNENEKNNITTINLGECETKLKEHYKIPKDKYLYILRIDVPQEGTNMLKMGYEVYYPLNGKNLEKLNLSYCEKAKVDISIPFEITEDMDKLNSSSDYYNDICYTYTSEKGTDISLKDRQKEYVDKNMTVCEENCDFSNYNTNTGKALCSCEIKIKLPLISEIKLDKNKLFDSFTDIKNIANINIMKCYKVFFSIKGISYNYGCYIIIPIFIIHIICTFLFYLKNLKEIKKTIKNIITAKKNFPKLDKIISKWNSIQKKQINNIQTSNPKNEKKSIKYHKILVGHKEVILKLPIFAQLKKIKSNINRHKKKNVTVVKKLTTKQNNNIIFPENGTNGKNEQNLKLTGISTSSKAQLKIIKKYEFCKQILKLNEFELNELLYKDAIKKDQRNYCSYYISLIKIKHLLIFSFFPMEDYNSRVIKIDLFFINFAIYYTVNALFFNDKTMHKIYLDNGDYNIIYQLPQILYSSLISGLINAFLKFLSLIGVNIIQIKHTKANLDSEAKKIVNLSKNKLLLFFIISYVLLLMFWYYVGCFCAIYRNTQIHLIKDSVISFGLSLIYPFFIYIFPGIFRIPSLKNKKDKRQTMYKFSKILQAF